jgi:hypothetical protein
LGPKIHPEKRVGQLSTAAWRVRSRLGTAVAGIGSTHLVVLLCCGLFAYLVYFYLVVLVGMGWRTDISFHARAVRLLIVDHAWPGHFLFFATVAAFAGFNPDLDHLLRVACIVLCLAIVLKFIVTRGVVLRLLSFDQAGRTDSDRQRQTRLVANVATLVVFSLLFAFTVPPLREWLFRFGLLGPGQWTVYLGTMPPNAWHNSTFIFLMPFAVWLFWSSYRFLETGDARYLRTTVLLIVLSLLAKPSFFLAFSVAFPALALARFGFTRKLAQAVGAVLVGGVVLAAQYIAIYIFPTGIEAPGGIGVSFLDVWRHYSSNIPMSLLLSFAFPLAFALSYYRDVKYKLLLHYSLACLAAALLVAVCLTEVGTRAYSCNFFWQVFACNYLLFMVCLVEFLRISFQGAARGAKWHLTAAVYGLHVVGGLMYLQKFITVGYQ